MQRHVHVPGRLLHRLPHADQERLDLFPAPSEAARERPQGDRTQAIEQDGLPPEAADLQRPVLRPRADGDVEDALGDVDEAGVADQLRQLQRLGEVDAEVAQALGDEGPELYDGVRGGERDVGRGLREVVDLLQLEPAAGLEMPVFVLGDALQEGIARTAEMLLTRTRSSRGSASL